MIIRYYRNSFLASLVSITGYTFIYLAIMGLIEGAPEALIFVAIGIPLIFLASKISERKAQKKAQKEREKELKKLESA